jgi:hypothetical protein
VVPVTVYVPAEVNEPVAVFTPLLHKYEPPTPAPEAVEFTVDPHDVSNEEADTVMVGLLFTVTGIVFELITHPNDVVTVKENIPD